MTIQLLQALRIAGVATASGTRLTLEPSVEADFVTRGVAAFIGAPPSVRRNEPLWSGSWTPAPSLFRLRLVGTGSLVVDSRDALGVVSSAVATFSADAATNQIEFPYLGDSAIEMRATFPSTMTVEVL